MNRFKLLALLFGLVMLLTISGTVSAQRVPPHVFVGTAAMAGAAAPDGTMVTASVDGQEAASTMVAGGAGGYTLLVDQGDMSFTGKTVMFRIGGTDAAESATWMQGGANELDLSTATGMMPGPTAMPAPTEPPSMVGPAGPEGPSGKQGRQGPQGPKGDMGEMGDKGDAGAAGRSGTQGPAGTDGADGGAGSQGPAGAAGAQGDTGPAGPAGAMGSSGSNVIGIIAIIIAAVAAVGAVGAFVMGRRG
jgi:hypothetical protein